MNSNNKKFNSEKEKWIKSGNTTRVDDFGSFTGSNRFTLVRQDMGSNHWKRIRNEICQNDATGRWIRRFLAITYSIVCSFHRRSFINPLEPIGDEGKTRTSTRRRSTNRFLRSTCYVNDWKYILTNTVRRSVVLESIRSFSTTPTTWTILWEIRSIFSASLAKREELVFLSPYESGVSRWNKSNLVKSILHHLELRLWVEKYNRVKLTPEIDFTHISSRSLLATSEKEIQSLFIRHETTEKLV